MEEEVGCCGDDVPWVKCGDLKMMMMGKYKEEMMYDKKKMVVMEADDVDHGYDGEVMLMMVVVREGDER